MDPFSIGMAGMSGLSALLGLFRGGDENAINSPELNRLLRLQGNRMRGQNPLFESVAKMAFNRMPTQSRQGFAAPSLADAERQMTPMDGDSNLPPELRDILRNQELRFHMTDPLYRAIQQLAGQRMPMGMQPPPGSNQWDWYGAPVPPGDPTTPPPDGPGPPDEQRPGPDDQQFTQFSNAAATNPWSPNYRAYY